MKRNKHSLSHTKLFSCDMGELVPCALIECLPGDSIQMATSMLVRASPLLAPVMHPVEVRLHHWFVPMRLIWEDWEDFITGGPDGMDASVFPTFNLDNTNAGVGTLADYLGVPIQGAGDLIELSPLPFRAYNLIWNEYYRDQDLQTEAGIDFGSGGDTATQVALRNCQWEKDYFTSARPWEQKGPQITIPLGTSAPLDGTAPVSGIGLTGTTAAFNLAMRQTAPLANTNFTFATNAGNPGVMVRADSAGAASKPEIFADLSGVTADLTSASAITINLLREALALQRFEEARARFGSRYVEYLRYLGVASSDARLQRPEYLGGGRQTIQFSEVLQTAEGTDPVGELRGHGIGGMRSNRFRRYIEEHGYVLSLFSVRPKTIYMQGLSRTWNRRTKEDFWQRELEAIGQQEILKKEIYADVVDPTATWGFQDRYDEYRRMESSVSGEFRTTALNHWHMAREFSSAPALNSTFVSCVPTERTFAVPSQDVIYAYAKHSVQARRLVSRTGKSFIY